MKKYNSLFMVSICALLSAFGILFLDVASIFKYSDLPFFLACVLYIVFIISNRSSSKLTFYIVLFLVCFMGISYLQNGFDTMTERIGEWFYLTFVIGLVQYAKELKTGSL